jgi:hypothetical protein
MRRALALTDHQLRLVRHAARSLPVARRDRFLRAVAAQLAGTPADSAVEQAVNVALDRAQPVRRRKQMAKKSPYVHERLDTDVLRDGERRTVPMMLKDGSTVELEDWQRDVIYAHRLGLNDALALHRPGQRFCTDQAANDARERAYEDSRRELEDAWRKPVAAPPPIEPRANITDARSVPRTMSIVPRSMTIDAAQKIKDEAWLEMCRELEGAWRKPLP